MSLIQSLMPLLKNGSSVNFNLKEVNGQIQILIEPNLAKVEPETTDEVVATLQAALLHPVRLLCKRESTDAEVIAALTAITPGHEAANDQLVEYRQRLADASAEAKRKAEEKSAAKAAKAPAKPSKVTAAKGASSLTAPADESEGDNAQNAEGSQASASQDNGDEASSAAASPATADFSLF